MKQLSISILFLLVLICSSCSKKTLTFRTKENFGNNWQFKQTNQSSWENITIPHSSKIENLVVVNQFEGTTEYQKKFYIKKDDLKKYLYFEGVMIEADVFINGTQVANHKGGYLPFTIDITNLVATDSENTITVKVSNLENQQIPPGKPLKDLDFNYYGGIYRNIYLISTSKLSIKNTFAVNKIGDGGIYVNFKDITKNKATATIQTYVSNEFANSKTFKLRYLLQHKNGQKVTYFSDENVLEASSNKTITTTFDIQNPQLWSVNNPNLYQLEVQILVENQLLDSYTETVGIRKSEIKSDGYYLNDEKLFINGTNRHQEYPYLGYAISDEAQYRDAVKIKNAGFDMVRLSHYPQAEAFLNACDELGILVMNSLAGWQFFGNEQFEENSYQQLRDMIRRDRNHASIIFWENSLNETEMPEKFMKNANVILKEELPLNYNYSASWIDNDNYDIFIPARQHAKAPFYWNNYDKGNRKIFIAEYGDWEYYAQNAGFNQKEFSNLKEEERTSRQLRGFGEKRLLQQAYNFQEASNSNRRGKNTIGEANWVMFDYNRGYSPDLESSGISDIFRIPKYVYYFYQSQRDATAVLDAKLTSGPMLTIATEWTKLSPLDIRIYSNCEEIELYLNDKLIGKQKPEITENTNLLLHAPFIFKTSKYEEGTLKAVGFINGKKVVENSITSPKAAIKINLSYDISSVEISKENPDVVFIYASIKDQNGTIITDATNEVTFSLEGKNAKLIGQNPVKAEAGIATILLRTDDFKTNLKISAEANALQSDTIMLRPKTPKRFF